MNQYVIRLEFELYGPYHCEAQAKFAEQLFASKYPDLAKSLSILPVDLSVECTRIYGPEMLC